MTTPRVVYVPTSILHRDIDPERLRAIHPDIELLTVEWAGLDPSERIARTRDPGSQRLRDAAQPLTDEQAAAFGRAEIVVALDLPFDLPERAPNLRWVHALGSGVEHYRAAGLDRGPIVLTNSAGIGAAPIAEWVMGRVIQMVKRFPEHDASAARHEWASAPGEYLVDMTMAIVGLGEIGRAVAARARAFGIRVIGVRRSVSCGDVDPDVAELSPADDLHEVLRRSDIVVLCAAGSQSNRDLFDREVFGAMREGSWFVNVSRGDLVDEPALIAALGSGQLAGAAIDVARNEPMPPDDPLWSAPNLLVSAHSSAAGTGYGRRVIELFVENLERYLAGEPLVNVVDTATL